MIGLASDKKNDNLPFFVASFILISIGYAFSKGLFFHPAQVFFLLLGWLVLFLPFLKQKPINFDFSANHLLLAAGACCFCLFLFFDESMYINSRPLVFNLFSLKAVAFWFFLFYFIDLNVSNKNFFGITVLHLAKYKFVYLLLIAFCLRLLTIFASPNPQIDVFWFLQGGADSLLSGHNPYSEIFFNPYSPQQGQQLYGTADFQNDNYSYWPSTVIFTTIFKFLFGDVRFAYVFAIFGAGAAIYYLARKKFFQTKQIAELLTLLIIYLPLSLFVLEQAWSEPLSIFLLALFVLFSFLDLGFWPYLIFSLFLGVKQVSLVFLFFLIRFKEIDWKKYSLTLGGLVILIIPFLIWQPFDFIDDTIINLILYKPSLHSLSLNTISRVDFYTSISALIYLPILFLLIGFLWIKTKRDLAGIIHAALVFLLALFIIRQGYANYYYGILGWLVILMTLEFRKTDQTKNEYENK
ncbi:MAG: hypothetical protein WCW26_05480 [Candidatus Buchananbacteria bacterium]